MDGSFYIWVRVGWRRRDLWLAGVTFFLSWVSILVFHFGLFSLRVSCLSIFMGSRTQNFFYFRAIELEFLFLLRFTRMC